MGQTPTIVVADDDQAVLQRVKDTLTALPANVVTATDGVKAVELIRESNPDLIILDAVMPRMEGLEVCRIAKSIARDAFLPVVLLTARDDRDYKIYALKHGADDHIAKPFEDDLLLARVTALLRIKSLQDSCQAKREELESMQLTDVLTQLPNDRAGRQRLREEFLRARRYTDPLAVLMVGIDDLDGAAKVHGRPSADQLVADISKLVLSCVRETDFVARFGVDHFLVVLPQTHVSGALPVAERIWKSVGVDAAKEGAMRIAATLSIGVSCYPLQGISKPDELQSCAEEALQQARTKGADRICLHQQIQYMYNPPTRTAG